ncbi:MAG TPA: NAD-dependent epimerase/dehydratase family protein [Acidimicrobiia bacterium]|nr:NAD-dependent epimerase/dehydratase family protein [Acidimicrobiia bacterium]
MTARVLVTGMGGHIGTRVAQRLEDRSWVDEIVGVDFVPPRRRLRRAEFRRIDPRERDRLATFVEEFAPTVVAHFGVYEPAARMTPASARERTELSALATLGAAARTGKLEYIVVRSGLEVYGPRSPRASVPDEELVPVPSTAFGRTLLAVEGAAKGVSLRTGVPFAALRYAPIVGSHTPSPLGRLLRLPVVPVSAIADPPFMLLHPDDAADAMVAAIERRLAGPCNVVGPGAATPWQAARLGSRVPLPIPPGLWGPAMRAAEIAGAAIAPHVVELLRHGRTGDGSRARDELGLTRLIPTQDVLRELFEWADVVAIPTSREQVA